MSLLRSCTPARSYSLHVLPNAAVIDDALPPPHSQSVSARLGKFAGPHIRVSQGESNKEGLTLIPIYIY